MRLRAVNQDSGDQLSHMVTLKPKRAALRLRSTKPTLPPTSGTRMRLRLRKRERDGAEP